MKLLLDQNISFRLVPLLEPHFPGTSHINRLGLTNKPDLEIWNFARRNHYLLVTFDSDFYDLSVTFGSPPKLIWIKSGNLTTQHLGNLLLSRRSEIDVFSIDPELTCLEIQ